MEVRLRLPYQVTSNHFILYHSFVKVSLVSHYSISIVNQSTIKDDLHHVPLLGGYFRRYTVRFGWISLT